MEESPEEALLPAMQSEEEPVFCGKGLFASMRDATKNIVYFDPKKPIDFEELIKDLERADEIQRNRPYWEQIFPNGVPSYLWPQLQAALEKEAVVKGITQTSDVK